jgi:uncharacterized membrane protein YfcA
MIGGIAIFRQPPGRRATLLPVTKLTMKKAAIFLYVIVNGTWALIAYLLHKVGVPLRAIAFVLGIGVILGNLAAYAGVKLAAKILGRPPGHFE